MWWRWPIIRRRAQLGTDEELLKCTKCSRTLDCRPVPLQLGYGIDRVLIVGEAPGAEEVEERKPFVGSAGRLFNGCLSAAGLRRGDFFVTNTIRCRPPNNRDPLDEEIENCRPWLVEEIGRVKPRLIVALGRAAARTLAGVDSDWRGAVVNSYYGVPCLVTYHPAFVMRSRTDIPVLIHDLGKIAHPIRSYETNYRIDPPIEVAREYLRRWKEEGVTIALDIETSGDSKKDLLNPWRGQIAGFAACGKPGDAFQFMFGREDHLERWDVFRELVEEFPNCWHNNSFDRCFASVKGLHPRQPVWDTQTGMYITHSGMEKSLDFLRSLYTTIPPYKKAWKRGGFSGEETAEANVKDVDITQQVMLVQQERYFNPQQKGLMERILTLDTLALKMRLRGVPVDQNVMACNMMDVEPEIARLEGSFYEQWNANPRSPKQLAELFYDRLRLPSSPKRKGKSDRSTDEKTVEWLKAQSLPEVQEAMVNDLLTFRGLDKLRSTFIQGWFDCIEEDGRLHPPWNTTGTDTGRWSCSKPNVQNPPQRTRNQVVAPEGKIFVGGDYRSMELMCMFILAGDYDSANLIMEGMDVHGDLQKTIAEFYPTITRLQTKTVVFGTGYGRTAMSIARDYRVSKRTAEAWQVACINKYPKLLELQARNKSFFETNGYVESLFGRRKYCDVYTQALNMPVQSLGADVTHNAVLKLEEEGFCPIINMHDEVLCEIDEPPEEKKKGVLERFEQIMSASSTEVWKWFPCKPRMMRCWQKEGEE